MSSPEEFDIRGGGDHEVDTGLVIEVPRRSVVRVTQPTGHPFVGGPCVEETFIRSPEW
jgi:hypothetical protein